MNLLFVYNVEIFMQNLLMMTSILAAVNSPVIELNYILIYMWPIQVSVFEKILFLL